MHGADAPAEAAHGRDSMIAAAWGSYNRGAADSARRAGRRPDSGRPGTGEPTGPLLDRSRGRRVAGSPEPVPPPVDAGVGQGQAPVWIEGERHGAGADEDVLGVARHEA